MLLKFAIKNFIEEKKLNNVSAATMERYVGTTSEFHAFCVEEFIFGFFAMLFLFDTFLRAEHIALPIYWVGPPYPHRNKAHRKIR